MRAHEWSPPDVSSMIGRRTSICSRLERTNTADVEPCYAWSPGQSSARFPATGIASLTPADCKRAIASAALLTFERLLQRDKLPCGQADGSRTCPGDLHSIQDLISLLRLNRCLGSYCEPRAEATYRSLCRAENRAQSTRPALSYLNDQRRF